jgi:hypothetical protein
MRSTICHPNLFAIKAKMLWQRQCHKPLLLVCSQLQSVSNFSQSLECLKVCVCVCSTPLNNFPNEHNTNNPHLLYIRLYIRNILSKSSHHNLLNWQISNYTNTSKPATSCFAITLAKFFIINFWRFLKGKLNSDANQTKKKSDALVGRVNTFIILHTK